MGQQRQTTNATRYKSKHTLPYSRKILVKHKSSSLSTPSYLRRLEVLGSPKTQRCSGVRHVSTRQSLVHPATRLSRSFAALFLAWSLPLGSALHRTPTISHPARYSRTRSKLGALAFFVLRGACVCGGTPRGECGDAAGSAEVKQALGRFHERHVDGNA